MGKTSSTVKNRWNKQHYKQIACQLDKALVAEWERKLKKDNITKSEFIRNAIITYLKAEDI